MKTTLPEAQKLIELYFAEFPRIKLVLNAFGRFGVENGYIKTLHPFNRRRYFPYWRLQKVHIREHLAGNYNPDLGAIERASKNMPFQGSGGDMVKLAMWLTYKHIRDNNLVDKVHLLLNVHDQLTTEAESSIAKDWAITFDKLMVGAADVIITSKILKADTTVSPVWTK